MWYQLKTTPGGPETLSSHSAALYQTDQHNPVAQCRQHHSNPASLRLRKPTAAHPQEKHRPKYNANQTLPEQSAAESASSFHHLSSPEYQLPPVRSMKNEEQRTVPLYRGTVLVLLFFGTARNVFFIVLHCSLCSSIDLPTVPTASRHTSSGFHSPSSHHDQPSPGRLLQPSATASRLVRRYPG